MSTVLRPELSEKNKYYISKQRYYELKHFCLQYHEWKMGLQELDIYPRIDNGERVLIGDVAKPVEMLAEMRGRYLQNMDLVEKTAQEADKDIWKFILIGVTEGVAYEFLYSRLEIPCSKDIYYDRYRRFFWLLDNARK
ncbi:MAG: hypothetical protein J6U54_11210 [Clostridiales bacterium]|nr:hypothetical protein [Clostridiales bacterium]